MGSSRVEDIIDWAQVIILNYIKKYSFHKMVSQTF